MLGPARVPLSTWFASSDAILIRFERQLRLQPPAFARPQFWSTPVDGPLSPFWADGGATSMTSDRCHDGSADFCFFLRPVLPTPPVFAVRQRLSVWRRQICLSLTPFFEHTTFQLCLFRLLTRLRFFCDL